MAGAVACRIVAIGLVSFFTRSLNPVGAIAQERTYEHVLIRAARCGDVELLKDILCRGTPSDLRASDGTTPLMYAALQGSAEMVELLLNHGANPRVANERGVTALLWGARNEETVRLLIRRGADVNARSALDNTPLMVAAASPNWTSP